MTIGSWVQENIVKPAIAELTKPENLKKIEDLIKKVVEAEADRIIDALGGQITDVAQSITSDVNSVTDNIAEEINKGVDGLFENLKNFLPGLIPHFPGIPGFGMEKPNAD